MACAALHGWTRRASRRSGVQRVLLIFDRHAPLGCMQGMAKSLAKEGEARGIKVNALAPGGGTAMVSAHGDSFFDAQIVMPLACMPMVRAMSSGCVPCRRGACHVDGLLAQISPGLQHVR